eukprot:TRINITY_DN93506_c0_g1_i1.p1 TRINITY_DN93506_c0_g1~~TRINITY_DN93506_c0_g1_i1.p1  ORF type:complete len:327 (-),score=55.74 TRINITY_DN93506_c0_g1_i1:97-1077(-)
MGGSAGKTAKTSQSTAAVAKRPSKSEPAISTSTETDVIAGDPRGKPVNTRITTKSITQNGWVTKFITTELTFADGTTQSSTKTVKEPCATPEATVEDVDNSGEMLSIVPGESSSKPRPLPAAPSEELSFAPPAMSDAELEAEVFNQLNIARQNPGAFAVHIEQRLQYMENDTFWFPGIKVGQKSQEGRAVYEEAINFLRQQQPVVEFERCAGLDRACKDHAEDTGKNGIIGHTGSDQSDVELRCERYGEYNGKMAENLSYSRTSPLDIVLAWIVDDGNASRGQRKNIFEPLHLNCGVGFATHKIKRCTCVVVFTTAWEDKQKNNRR